MVHLLLFFQQDLKETGNEVFVYGEIRTDGTLSQRPRADLMIWRMEENVVFSNCVFVIHKIYFFK